MGSEMCIRDRLLWEDVGVEEDGSGTIYLRQSKTDREGEGKTLWISRYSVWLLKKYGWKDSGRVFPIVTRTVRYRLDKICKITGLTDLGVAISGHSARIGKAIDLMEDGASTAEIMSNGRWKSTMMLNRYTAQSQAKNSASAKYDARHGVQPPEED